MDSKFVARVFRLCSTSLSEVNICAKSADAEEESALRPGFPRPTVRFMHHGKSDVNDDEEASPALPQFVTARDFAESTGIPLRTLHRNLIEGLIPGAARVGPGKKWRIAMPTKELGRT